jgi:hypothetical protein
MHLQMDGRAHSGGTTCAGRREASRVDAICTETTALDAQISGTARKAGADNRDNGMNAEPISNQIRRRASELIEAARASGADLAASLNVFLNSFLVWPFLASPGIATNSEGHNAGQFGTLVYANSHSMADAVPQDIPADLLACAIDVSIEIGIEELRDAYERIAAVKRLKKRGNIPSVASPSVPVASSTLGIILAADSKVPLESLAEEIDKLNRYHPAREWPDMVVILSRGTINVACQMPEMSIADYLPPSGDNFVIAPMYLHLLIRSEASFALNRMCALLFTYLELFSPGGSLPKMPDVLKGASNIGLTFGAYQYNLKRELVAVPLELRFARFISPIGFRAEDPAGNLLSTIRYLPWQDGGVLHLSGKLPLEAFLVFAGSAAMGAHKFKLRDGEMTSVLPLTSSQFVEMATRVAKQSNLTIKPEVPRWTLTKISDEGTSTPYIARLFAGLLELRDQAGLKDAQRENFDKAFDALLNSLNTARAASKEAVELFATHCSRVSRGEVVKMTGNSIHITEGIDTELRKHVESFISSGGRAFKDRMQEVLRSLGIDIGFLYKQVATFDQKIQETAKSAPVLSDYLRETRTHWSERFSRTRIALEHGSWVLPKIRYEEKLAGTRAIEPDIDGQLMSQFIAHMLDRLCCFVEDLCAYALQARMDARISITEIPITKRPPEFPRRFQSMLVGGGLPIWILKYHDGTFEET